MKSFTRVLAVSLLTVALTGCGQEQGEPVEAPVRDIAPANHTHPYAETFENLAGARESFDAAEVHFEQASTIFANVRNDFEQALDRLTPNGEVDDQRRPRRTGRRH